MQADGNLVIYRGTDPSASQGPCWATNTCRSGVGPAYQAVLTGDGNLEVQRTSGAVTSPIWQSKLDYSGKRVNTGASLTTNQWVAHPARLVSAKQASEAMFVEGGGISTWCSIPPGMGQAFANPRAYVTAIRDDGTLGVYAGDDPATTAAPLWSNGGTNPHATTVRNPGGTQQIAQADADTFAGWTSTAPLKVQFLLSNDLGNPSTAGEVTATTDQSGFATSPVAWCHPDGTTSTTMFAFQAQGSRRVACATNPHRSRSAFRSPFRPGRSSSMWATRTSKPRWSRPRLPPS